jgi:hypothetical protein
MPPFDEVYHGKYFFPHTGDGRAGYPHGKCPETSTFFAPKPAHLPPILHIGATFLGETTFHLEYQHEML